MLTNWHEYETLTLGEFISYLIINTELSCGGWLDVYVMKTNCHCSKLVNGPNLLTWENSVSFLWLMNKFGLTCCCSDFLYTHIYIYIYTYIRNFSENFGFFEFILISDYCSYYLDDLYLPLSRSTFFSFISSFILKILHIGPSTLFWSLIHSHHQDLP